MSIDHPDEFHVLIDMLNTASLMGYRCMSRDVALLLDESWGAPVHASSEAGPSGLHERPY